MSNHPSENVDPQTVQVGPKSDPILIWYGLIQPRLDAALSAYDQAYRLAKTSASNVDDAAREARKKRLENPVIGEDNFMEVEPDAVLRTHLRAMEGYGMLAAAFASSIRDALALQPIEIEERIVSS